MREGQKRYKKEALKHNKEYDFLLNAQNKLPKTPNWEIDLITKLLSIKPILSLISKKYEKI